MRLIRSTTFRLSLLAALLFSLVAATGLGVIYWSTARELDTQIDARLRLQRDILLRSYRGRTLPAVTESVSRRTHRSGRDQVSFFRLEQPRTATAPPPAADLPWPAGPDEEYALTLRLDQVFPPAALDETIRDQKVRLLIGALPNGARLLVGADLGDEDAFLRHILEVIIGVVALTIVLALLVSTWLARLTWGRIHTISRTAGAIMAGDLNHRIPIGPRRDEFDTLGEHLNAMLDRNQQLLDGLRQVTDNIAHDLRGPLSRLRNRLEVTQLEARDTKEYRRVMEQSIADADGLLNTFNALLSIARAEAGVQGAQWEAIDLVELVRDLGELYSPLAEEQGLDLRIDVPAPAQGGGQRVQGDRQLLAQALGNLLDNAIKYTPAPGAVTLGLEAQDQTITVVVADTGPGIPADQRQRVLERFVRLDSARSNPGNGLGLSLVKAVARLHGAQLFLEDNPAATGAPPMPGLRVGLRLRRAGK